MPRETINIVRHTDVASRVHVGWDNHDDRVQIGVEIPGFNGQYASMWTDNLTEQELTDIIRLLKKIKRKQFPTKR